MKIRERFDIPKKIYPLLDARNLDLWEYLITKNNIEVVLSKESGYLTSFDSDQIVIQADEEDLNPASMTHELLHIWLKDQDVLIAKDLEEMVDANQTIQPFFSPSLKTHIGNCLEHQKMLPLFLKRGFKNDEFISDFYDRVMSIEELRQLKQSFRTENGYDPAAVDTYIGKFFSIKAANNFSFDYTPVLKGLQNLDSVLYEALSSFWLEWLDFTIGDAKEKYRTMLKRLMTHLGRWAESNKIIKK